MAGRFRTLEKDHASPRRFQGLGLITPDICGIFGKRAGMRDACPRDQKRWRWIAVVRLPGIVIVPVVAESNWMSAGPTFVFTTTGAL